MSGMNRLQAHGLRGGIIHCKLQFYFGMRVRENSTQEKQPWARRLGSGCNEWSVAEWFADTDQASRAACEWSKGGAKRWFENPITLCSICTKWNVVFLEMLHLTVRWV